MITTLNPGTRLRNRYQIIKLLGRGGQCIVYLTYDQFTGKSLVVKCLINNAQSPQDRAQNLQLFMKEQVFLSKLDHPSLPKGYEYFQEGGYHYIAVEFVPGQSMEQILKRSSSPIPEKQSIDWGIELAKTLVYLSHQKPHPIIIRDIKPSNIQITPDNKAKLIDFTIAREWKDRGQDTVRMGSPGYAAPEQYKGRSDIRSDIYSLGVTLYEILTKKDPSENPFNFPPIRQINPNISEELEKILLKAMETNADQRYQNPKEMLEDLKSLVEMQNMSALDKAAKFFTMGEEEFKLKNYKKALEHYENALKCEPDIGEYLCRIGETRYALGNSDKGLMEIYKGFTLRFKGILSPLQINKIREKYESIKKQMVTSWPMFSNNLARTSNQAFETELSAPLTSGWEKNYFDVPPKSSPAIADDMLFIGTKSGKVLCVDITSGTMNWAFDTGKPVISSPTYYKGIIYFGSNDTNIYAVKNNGKKLWHFKTNGPIFASPAIYNDILYIGSSDNKLYALNYITIGAKKLWEFDSKASIISSPAIYEDKILFGNMSSSLFAINSLTGQIKWIFDTTGPISSTPAVENNLVYIGSFDGKLYAVDISTGRLKWIYTTGGKLETNVAIADGVVYITSTDMNIYAIDAYRGTKIWNYQTDSPILSSPVVANKIVYVITNNIYCLSASSGQLMGKTKIVGPTHASPAIAKGNLYFASSNFLYSYGSSAGLTIKYAEEAYKLFKAGQYFKAAEIYKKVVAIERKIEYLDGLAKSCYYSEDDNLIDEAINAFQELIASNYSTEYSVMLGDLMFKKTDYKKSLLYYQKAIKINDNLDWPHFRVGFINYKFKANPIEAINEIQKAIKINPKNPAYVKTLGEIFESLGQEYEALKFYTKVLVLNPKDSDAKKKLTNIRNTINAKEAFEEGKKLIIEGNLDKAIIKFQEAVKNRPDSAEYHYELGKSYLQKGDKKFLAELKQSLAIDPSNRDYLMTTGNALYELLSKDPSARDEETMNFAMEVIKKLDNHILFGNFLLLCEKYEEALMQYNLSMITVGGIIEYKKSQCFLKLNKINAAIACLRRAIEQEPSEGIYYKELAFLLLKINKETEAIDILKKSSELIPEDKEIIDKIKEISQKYEDGEKNFRDGKDKLLLNQLDEAITLLNKAIELVPVKPEYYAKLSEAYLYSKKLNEAEKTINKSIELTQGESPYLVLLGDIFIAQNNFSSAIEAYKKAIEKNSLYIDGYLKLGEVYEKTANIEEALTEFQKAYTINPLDDSIKQRIDILINLQSMKRWTMKGREGRRQSFQEIETTLAPPAILRWSFLAENWIFETKGKIRSSPVIDYGTVYIGSYDGNLYAIDIQSGEKKWQNITGKAIHSTPLICKDNVYCGSMDNNLYAFEAITGKFLWKFNTGSRIISSPVSDKEFIYVTGENGTIFALNISTGNQNWNKKLPCPIQCSPSLEKEILYTGGMDGKIYALKTDNGEILWEQTLGGKITGSIVIGEEFLYGGSWNKYFYCMKKENGQFLWTFKTGGKILSSPAFDGKSIYFGCEDKKVYSLNASSGEKNWEIKTKSRVNSSPAVANKLIYIGSDVGKIYAFGVDDGRPWEYQTKGPVISSPAIAEGMLFTGSDDGKLYCFRNYRSDETPLPTAKEEGKNWWKLF
ncbi:MAG TPA: PQQ-binding-like beta-propeller repeat protein [Candidatus Eremiobacteraeota bacterium]|nr:MAG: Serine/threonine-protein kinase PknB [bacterium ADurb.Bin363]HPZ08075.1 PQQ-binding-like beta-propeller repeat protein [Candidatus Eremiobacteraeota bacterium]